MIAAPRIARMSGTVYCMEEGTMIRNESRYIGAEKFLNGESFSRANIITDGQTIYSYGSHFPMARNLHDGTIAVNIDRYSPTTSKHQSALRAVLGWNGYKPSGQMADIHNRYAFELWTRS